MTAPNRNRIYFLLGILAATLNCKLTLAQQSDGGSGAAPQIHTQPDGQHDFDFAFGAWRTHIKKLQHPLTGSTTWVEMNGTKVAKKIWSGRAQLEEIEADGPTGHFEVLTLLLYNPESHQWSQSGASSTGGTLGQAAFGEFKNGRGEFLSQEEFNGRQVLVRAVWSEIMPESYHFEQSFSDDGGKTWELNFVATLTRDKS